MLCPIYNVCGTSDLGFERESPSLPLLPLPRMLPLTLIFVAESTCYSQERHDHYARMSTPRNSPSRITPFGLLPPGLDTRPSLLRPASPSNDSSASTDDDTISANVDPYALEYYLGNDVTWRESEILSQSSEEELADDGLARHFHGAQHPAR